MEIRILTDREQDKFDKEILDMLEKGDTEFVPPLSSRNSTLQSDFAVKNSTNQGVLNYFNELKKQKILVAVSDEKLVGFVSFRENFVNDKIGEESLPNIYISTAIVAPESRGKGVITVMYETLFKEYENANVFTRTWSTNEAHIRVLSKFGFEIMSVLKNDRGNGIDTVYFKKTAKIF